MPSNGSISLPSAPNEWKLRGKAPQGLRKRINPEKFDYTRYFARKVRSNQIKFLRRRLWRRRKMPQPTLGPPKNMRKAGQHRLPGGLDAEGPG